MGRKKKKKAVNWLPQLRRNPKLHISTQLHVKYKQAGEEMEGVP